MKRYSKTGKGGQSPKMFAAGDFFLTHCQFKTPLKASQAALKLFGVVEEIVDKEVEDGGVNVEKARQGLYCLLNLSYLEGHDYCYNTGKKNCHKTCVAEFKGTISEYCFVKPGATTGLLGPLTKLYPRRPIPCPTRSRYTEKVKQMQEKHIAIKNTSHFTNFLMECALWGWIVHRMMESRLFTGIKGSHSEAKAFRFRKENRTAVQRALRRIGNEWVRIVEKYGWVEEDIFH